MVDQTLHRAKAAFEHRTGRSANWEPARLQRCERELGHVQVVAQLVGEKTQPLVLLLGLSSCHLEVALGSELGHRVGNRIVQTAVQGAELIDRKRGIPLDGQVSDGLAQVPIVMNDLIDRVAEPQQFATVDGCRNAHLRKRRSVASGWTRYAQTTCGVTVVLGRQGARQLVEEHRNAIQQLLTSGTPRRPQRNLVLTSLDEFVAIVQQEAAHMDRSSMLRRSAGRRGVMAESSRVASADQYAPKPSHLSSAVVF
jgi:hypothetical protein